MSSVAAERVRQALLKSGGIEERDVVEYLKKINSRRFKGQHTKAIMLKAASMKNPMDKNLKVKVSRRHQTTMKMVHTRQDPLDFFKHIHSIHQTRLGDHIAKRRPGLERILANLEAEATTAYDSLVKSPKQWIIDPIPELNIMDTDQINFIPQYLLGVGGQGCVLGVKVGDEEYAVKFRARQKKTTSPSNRRKSPVFRKRGGEVQEEDSGNSANTFLNDSDQEPLHREAVGMFCVNAVSDMHPKPYAYGIVRGGSYEAMVMELSDFTLHDIVQWTTWKTRMIMLNTIWEQLKLASGKCFQGGVVHHDIKPDNVGIKLKDRGVKMGFIDYGISRREGYELTNMYRNGRIVRMPGTVTYMSPRTHLWMKSSWIDDHMGLFFTMYNYSTAEGKNDYSKLSVGGLHRRLKNPLSADDRKNAKPEELAIYCLKYPPWVRFSNMVSQKNTTLKKKINEQIIKEEISTAMLKIHAMTNPKDIDDIVSIILNSDGYLDDTTQDETFKDSCAQFLRGVLRKHLLNFVGWWLEYAKDLKKTFERAPVNKDQYTKLMDLVNTSIDDPKSVEELINNSTCGKLCIEASVGVYN